MDIATIFGTCIQNALLSKTHLDFKASLIYVLLHLLLNKVQSLITTFGKVGKGLILAFNNVLWTNCNNVIGIALQILYKYSLNYICLRKLYIPKGYHYHLKHHSQTQCPFHNNHIEITNSYWWPYCSIRLKYFKLDIFRLKFVDYNIF